LSAEDNKIAAELYSALWKLKEHGISRNTIDAFMKEFYAQAFPPKRRGRKRLMEDDAHLMRMLQLLRDHPRMRINTAARKVSAEIGCGDNPSTSERLRRKLVEDLHYFVENIMAPSMNKAVAELAEGVENNRRKLDPNQRSGLTERTPLVCEFRDGSWRLVQGEDLKTLSHALDYMRDKIIPEVIQAVRKYRLPSINSIGIKCT
jgi:hypothetical protein